MTAEVIGFPGNSPRADPDLVTPPLLLSDREAEELAAGVPEDRQLS